MYREVLVALISLTLAITLFAAYARSGGKTNAASTSSAPASLQAARDLGPIDANDLSSQPEAVKLIRRLGGFRFSDKGPKALVITGVLTSTTEERTVQIARRQNARGERVEIAFMGDPKQLSWDASSGPLTSGDATNASERALLERLTFDSADQFILAQLRGASYYVVARNVRPDNAPDNYDGPIWDVVRIDDPEADEQKHPLSPWRLYYINNKTGLIDKVASEPQGERIEANLSNWTERDGEKFPSTITWTSNGQTLMTLTLTNVSSLAQ